MHGHEPFLHLTLTPTVSTTVLVLTYDGSRPLMTCIFLPFLLNTVVVQRPFAFTDISPVLLLPLHMLGLEPLFYSLVVLFSSARRGVCATRPISIKAAVSRVKPAAYQNSEKQSHGLNGNLARDSPAALGWGPSASHGHVSRAGSGDCDVCHVRPTPPHAAYGRWHRHLDRAQ